MKYYLDTEFIEDGKTIDLISIGIVAEDGRELYLGNKECDFSKASGWVIDNVLKPLGFERMPKGTWVEGHMRPLLIAPFWLTRAEIAQAVFQFVEKPRSDWNESLIFGNSDPAPTIEFWADYGSYDWVALCQLFGTMMDLPYGWPMYIHDLQQECDRLGKMNQYYQLPPQPAGQHNALEDARWLKSAYEALGL
jgi:hypothetical protein